LSTVPIIGLEAGVGHQRLLSRQFVILAAATSCFFLGAGAVNVLLPQYVVDDLGGSEASAGVAMGSMAVSALVSRVWFGRLADRRGARLILVIGAAIAAIASALLVVTGSIAAVIATRLLYGAGQAAFFTGATTLSIDLAPDHRRSQAASYILIAVHVGMGIGPIVAVTLSDRLSFDAIWLLTAGVISVGGIIAATLAYRPPDHDAEPSPWIHPNALGPGFVSLFGVVAFNGFLMFAPLYAREIGLVHIGLVFTVASITIVIVRLAFGWVPDAIGPIRAGSAALVLTALAALVVALWSEPAGMFAGAALLAIGLSLQSPSFIALAVDGVSPSERGSAMATFTGFFDLAGALVGPMFGLIVTGFSYRAAFLIASAMAVFALVILRLLVAPKHTGLDHPLQTS
jgi:MFS family permease